MKTYFIFFLLLFLIGVNTLSQELNYRAYSILDGVPSKLVFDVVQDSTGLMYFSSLGKIFSYDGVDWKIIYDDSRENQARFFKLFYDNKGNLWAMPTGSFQNILLFGNNSVKKIPALVNFKSPDILYTSIAVHYDDSSRVIYVGTTTELFEFRNEVWKRFDFYQEKSEVINSLSLCNDTLYYATANTIYSFDTLTNERKKIYDSYQRKILAHTVEKTANNKFKIWLLLEDEVGFIENKKYTTLYSNFSNLAGNFTTTGFISASKYTINWGSLHGIYSYNLLSKQVEQLGGSDDFTDIGAYSSLIDKENNTWFVSGRGIYKTRFSPFRNYIKEDGLLGSEVSAIEFFNNDIFFLGHEDGITIMNNHKVVSKKSFLNKPETNRVLDVVRDNKGYMWFTTQYIGIGKITSKKDADIEWVFEDDVDYYGVFIDKNENIWFSSDKGLYRIDENSNPVLELSIRGDYIRKIFYSTNGDMILCLNGGVINFTKDKNKLIQSTNSPVNNTYAYFDGFNDYNFVGTAAGLYILDSDTLKKFYYGDFYIDEPVYFISQDSLGAVWFGLSNGVIKWNGESSTYYSIETGLAGMETNRSAGKASHNGKFYIGTNNGFSIFDPALEYEHQNFLPLNFLYVEDGEGNKYPLNKKIELENTKDLLTIYYSVYSFINENSNLYEIGITKDNEKTTSIYYSRKNYVTIRGLEAGNYLLTVRLKNGLRQWSEKTSNSNLRIRTPFFNTTSAVLFIAVLVITLSFYILAKYKNKKAGSVQGSLTAGSSNSCYPKKIFDIPELSRIHGIMLEKAYYKDANLNIGNLAEYARIKPRNLSKIINTELGLNFNSYLNIYRVEDAKQKLTNEGFDEYSIDGVSKLAGFKSKSSFHKAFKKYTQQTPQEFKKKKLFDLQNGVNPH